MDMKNDAEYDLANFRPMRMSKSQFGLMLDFMILNPELMDPPSSKFGNRKYWYEKWEELASLLNADGTGAKKDALRWRKAWKDQKYILKRKLAKVEILKNSGLSGAYYNLTDLEERFLTLVDAENARVQNRKLKHKGKDLSSKATSNVNQETLNAINFIDQQNLNVTKFSNQQNLNVPNVGLQNLNVASVGLQNLNATNVIGVQNLNAANVIGLQTLNAANIVSQELSPTSIILIDASSLPISLPSLNFPLKQDSVKNGVGSGSETAGEHKPVVSAAESLTIIDISTRSTGTNNLTSTSNISNILPKSENATNNIETGIEKKQDSTEKGSSNLLLKVARKTLLGKMEVYRKRALERKKFGKDLNAGLKMKIKRPKITAAQKKHRDLEFKLRMKKLCDLRKSLAVRSQNTSMSDSRKLLPLSETLPRIQESSGISSVSEDIQESNSSKITFENDTDSCKQNSSNKSAPKRKKIEDIVIPSNYIEINKLLQKQNEILEGIAGTLMRIEKSLEKRSSTEEQRKNNALLNISGNVDKLTDCLEAVSNSLKLVAEK